MKQFCYLLTALLLLPIMGLSFAADTPKPKVPVQTTVTVTTTPVKTAAPTAQIATETTEPAASKTPASESRLWNLQDADILSVINEVSLETGKNFVVDPRVSGKITLVSSKPIKPEEVYQVFLSVLGLLGYSAIPNGNVIKIVPNMESGENATKVANKQRPGKGDEVVVRVIPLDSVSANQLIPVIRPLMPQWSNISAYTPGNVLILLGRANNLDRIVTIIRDIDHNSSNNIDIVPLHQAAASQLVTVLNNLQNASRASGDTPQVSIAADERSNSILLSGNKSARLHMRFLIEHLDTPSSGASGNTEVVYLRYLQAAKFAPLLGKIAQNMMGKNSGNASADTSASNAAPANSQAGGKDKTPENTTSIQAEPNTNAVIITAPPSMMTALNSVVAKLDIRPAQVLVEGIIVEVNEGSLKTLGIQWGSLTGAGTIATPSQPSDFPVPGAGNIGIIPNMSIVAILSFLQTQSGTNILSTPSIAVLDNQKAVLEIGQEVPIQTGSYATTGSSSTVTPFNTISTKPVTLKLQVIPQINLGNAVRLLINLKNDTLQNPNSPGLTPIINTSNIQNAVIINSQDVLVLGGLISDSVVETINKVPLLGDVPLVGKIFQQKIRQVQKKNLLVFIKPTILRNPDDSTSITNTKYQNIRTVQLNYPHDYAKLQEKAPYVLPPIKNNGNLPKPFEEYNN
jgi:general secretion pathway protein D